MIRPAKSRIKRAGRVAELLTRRTEVETVPVSIKFTKEQRELVEQAAKKRFMNRSAFIVRAAVMTASGKNAAVFE